MLAADTGILWVVWCTLGLSRRGEAVIGDAFWCRHFVAIRGAMDRMKGVARDKLRIADRGSVVDAIMCLY
jgi:hypothetical protein